MSISTTAFSAQAVSRPSSRKTTSPNFLGSAAIAAVVIGCAWTVYANVLGASVYPQLSSASYDTPVVRRTASIVAKNSPPVVNNFLGTAPSMTSSVAETPLNPLMFNERFAAAAPLADQPRLAAATPPNATAAAADSKIASATASKVAEISKAAAGLKLAEAKKTDAPKVAEATKPKDAAKDVARDAASTKVALNTPASVPAAKSSDGAPAKASETLMQRAKSAVMSIASNERQSIVEKLWGKQEAHGSLLSYASADANVTGSIGEAKGPNPMLGGSPPYDRQTAVYDITAHTVYLPDGTKLEAHSGLGSQLDDPHSSKIRMRGVTPPHIYELKPREALFHGVAALRLNPIGGEDAIFGRVGLLAHTYMLGPNGDSNGCVSFRDYNAFLNAYRNLGIKRLAVLARVE